MFTIRQIFVGRVGVRAGWSALLYALIYAGMVGVSLLALRWWAPGIDRLLHDQFLSKVTLLLTVLHVLTVALVLIATLVMAKIERRSVWSYGLTGTRSLGNFTKGLVAGLALLSLVIALLFFSGNFVFDGRALGGAAIFGYGSFWAVNFFLIGLFEETLFRGYPLQTLSRGIGFWPAAILLSVVFGLSHINNDGETAAGIIQVVLAGMILCLGRKLTGSLWWSIGFHAAWDWAQSFLYGTADSGIVAQGHLLSSHAAGDVHFSGGVAGPEGSPACIAVLLVTLAIMFVMAKRQSVPADAA